MAPLSTQSQPYPDFMDLLRHGTRNNPIHADDRGGRAKEYRIDARENGRVRTDPKRESHHGDVGEAEIPAQHAHGEPQIRQKALKRLPSSDIAAALLNQRDIAKLAASRGDGLLA